MQLIDLTGQTFGFMRVIRIHPERNKFGRVQWICRCICGKVLTVPGNRLYKGHTRSCGCKKGYLQRLAYNPYKDDPQGPNFNQLYGRIKLRAEERGLPFELTPGQARSLLESACHYCGLEPLQRARHPSLKTDFLYNGLDRKNPTKGYTLNNTVPCCWEHNRMKGSLGYEEFIDSVVGIVRHLYLQNKE